MPDLSGYLKVHLEAIEQRLEQLVPVHHGTDFLLYEAVRYSLLGAGKRIRPILTLAVTESLGCDVRKALTAASALELVHTYSLVHDDLPCMDNDDYRRGKLSLHRKYNEGIALLAGDFLLTRAFEVIAADTTLNSDQRVQLISLLARAGGGVGMIGGQVMDVSFDKKKASFDDLILLHRKKTGALIEASVEFGCIIAEAQAHQLMAFRHFAENIGLAFQIIDDVLDVTSSETKHGRVIGSDQANGKTTFATLLGVERAKEYANTHLQEAIKAIKPLHIDASKLIALAHFITHRQH